jgi:hypothetical protein
MATLSVPGNRDLELQTNTIANHEHEHCESMTRNESPGIRTGGGLCLAFAQEKIDAVNQLGAGEGFGNVVIRA